MKILSIFALLITVFLGFFHVVATDRSVTVIPKAAFTFADTFTSVVEVLARHNGQSLAERLRGDPQLDNLVRGLQRQKYIVIRAEEKPPEPVITPEPTSKGKSGFGSEVPDRCKGSTELAKCVEFERNLATETAEQKSQRQNKLEEERQSNIEKANR